MRLVCSRTVLLLAAATASFGLVGHAQAQVYAPPVNVVSLQASASLDVPNDWLTVVFSTTKEGTDATVVQNQLKQALDMALAEARKGAKPGQVDLQSGNFSLFPRYAPQAKPGVSPTISSWQGSTEMVVEGRDVQAIAALTGRIQSMTIARVGFSLSREARQKVEADISGQAIQAFRAKADAISKQFGFNGYTLREVAVNAELPMNQPRPMMRMAESRAMAADAALPTESGKATVTATVNGSVQMNSVSR